MGKSRKATERQVRFQLIDDDGTVRQVKLPKSQVEKWKRQRQTRRLPTVRVNIAGVRGARVEDWIVGKHLSVEDAEKWRDSSTDQLFVEEIFADGKLLRRFKKNDA